ncbi:MAG: phosphoribosylaminoimidazolesuccinocarboxamide synthase [Castellaniella sp.]
MSAALYQSSITSLPLLARGKVRDIYAVDEDLLLIVASDRISAFDVILDDPIPGKGAVLTSMTEFWLSQLADIVPNHATGIDPVTVVRPDEQDQVRGRAMVVKRLRPILVEAVVRGYLIGSGWVDYQASGQVCGIALPPGLALAARLPETLFTPAAKAEAGEHDENIDYATMVALVGEPLAGRIRDISLKLYARAAAHAATRGIIIADTKFEFGLDARGQLHLMDEVLTPDSSRFWPADAWKEGENPPSFDKQFLRDWLLTQDWDRRAPAPRAPADILQQTGARYQEALARLTGGGDDA